VDEERPGAERWVPADPTVDDLRTAVGGCRGCELWRDATQRGRLIDGPTGAAVLLTVHPSAVLRLTGTPEWDPAFEELCSDLRVAASAIGD
jgi:uracil-DNA glycosylase